MDSDGRTCITSFAMLCWSHAFTDFHSLVRGMVENFSWHPGWFWLFPLSHVDSAQIQGMPSCFCWIIHCCWLFAIPTLLNWTAGVLTNGDWNCLKELLLNRSISPCPIYCLFSPVPPCLALKKMGTGCLRVWIQVSLFPCQALCRLNSLCSLTTNFWKTIAA